MLPESLPGLLKLYYKLDKFAYYTAALCVSEKISIYPHHCITWHAPGQALSSLRIFKFRSASKAQKNVLAN